MTPILDPPKTRAYLDLILPQLWPIRAEKSELDLTASWSCRTVRRSMPALSDGVRHVPRCFPLDQPRNSLGLVEAKELLRLQGFRPKLADEAFEVALLADFPGRPQSIVTP